MTDDLEELKRRLVVGHKSDGRSVYDEAAKAELVALCMRPSASVSRLARECGVNANQVSRWLREHDQARRGKGVAGAPPVPTAFVAVPVVAGGPVRSAGPDDVATGMSLQARLPNGVAVDLRGLQPHNVGEVIEALGRLRCSVSTKA
jgi:transposase